MSKKEGLNLSFSDQPILKDFNIIFSDARADHWNHNTKNQPDKKGTKQVVRAKSSRMAKKKRIPEGLTRI